MDTDQKNKIEEKRRNALALRRQKIKEISKVRVVSSTKNIILIGGTNFIDTEGGFLLEDVTENKNLDKNILNEINPSLDCEQPTCLECNQHFSTSYLLQAFDYVVCDGCRDSDGKHCLITKTEAKNEYLLKDCDLDLREPPLKCILRQNPNNVTWGQMKLYLLLQVEKRALDVWGSMEKLDEARNLRKEKRIVVKTKQYNKNLKALRMAVRSSLYDHRIIATPHEHEFGEEKYDPEEDSYTRACCTCGFTETFEKM